MKSMHRSIMSLLNSIERYQPNQYLVGCEVGVWRGETSEFLLRQFPLDLHLCMVDSWEVEGNQVRAKDQETMNNGKQIATTRTEFAENQRTIKHMRSIDAAKDFRDGCFDFVFIDANHVYEYVKEDIEAWWPKVRTGGILLGHDYNGVLERRKSVWGVKRAVDEFANKNDLLVAPHPGLIFSMVKPNRSCDGQ